MGSWESLTFYHTFGAVDAPLTFMIQPRANIGGQGYAFLEMARPIIRSLHLPLTLATFRLPAVLFGMVSLILFFTICRRYFGVWPALGATALLAVNKVFFQFEHMMTVVVFSGAALLFLVERLQALEIKYWDPKVWAGLSIAMAAVALHYGPARIFGLTLFALWLAKTTWMFGKVSGAAQIRRDIWALSGYTIAGCALILAALDVRNVVSLLRINSFLLPAKAEVAEISMGSGAGLGVLRTLGVNLRLTAESLLGGLGSFGAYHSRFSTYILADFRFPLLSAAVLPLVLGGAMALASRRQDRPFLLATPRGNILALTIVLSAPLMFSMVALMPDGPLATLSTYRLYFLLFPLYILVARCLSWIAERGSAGAKYAMTALVGALFVWSVVGITKERRQFDDRVFAPTWRVHGAGARALWDDKSHEVESRRYVMFSHFQQHAQYANSARELAHALRGSRVGTGATSGRRLVFVDLNRFTEAPITPIGLDYLSHRNFHSIFLALYAGEAGAQVDPVIMVDSARTPVEIGGVGYTGRPREYSAPLQLRPNGSLGYDTSRPLVPVILELSGTHRADILVTTPEEEAGARRLLALAHIPFVYLRLPDASSR